MTAIIGAGANTAATDKMPGSTGVDGSSQSAASSSKLAQNFDTFLTMLTTQLKHQDPLSPMDSTQFTSQLVQFASVEQQINANKNLETLIGVQKTNQTAAAIGYLGQTVEIAGSDVPLQGGKGNFSYTLPSDAKDATVLIRNTDGTLVRKASVPTDKGRHDINWDGKDDNGNALNDGKYTFQVVANAKDGSTMDVPTTVFGRVTDLSSDTTGTLLSLGGVTTSLDKVLTIRDTASLASSTN
ncbi:MAG: flagellar hook assembly protein FlgD [Actinomycetota bacterium]